MSAQSQGKKGFCMLLSSKLVWPMIQILPKPGLNQAVVECSSPHIFANQGWVIQTPLIFWISLLVVPLLTLTL